MTGHSNDHQTMAFSALPQVGCEPEEEVLKLRIMRAQHGLCCICEKLNVMMLIKDLTFTLNGLLASFEGLYEPRYVEQYGCP